MPAQSYITTIIRSSYRKFITSTTITLATLTTTHVAIKNQDAVHHLHCAGNRRLPCLGAKLQRRCLCQSDSHRSGHPYRRKLRPQRYTMCLGRQLLCCQLNASACLR
jgi:hypothetical protein